MRVMYFDQVEVKCTRDELDEAMRFLDDGDYKVQVVRYGECMQGSGRQPGLVIMAARESKKKKLEA